MAPDDDPDFEARVRARIRALRTEAGLSLEALGRRAGMSASLLSRLESGARRLSVDHLAALARALGVSVDALLDVASADPRIRPVAHEGEGMTWWPLGHGADGAPTAFKVRIPPTRDRPEPRTHPGHDWIYVLSGRLLLHLSGVDHVLTANEAAEFPTTEPHLLAAVGGPCEILTVFGPGGQGIHLHGT